VADEGTTQLYHLHRKYFIKPMVTAGEKGKTLRELLAREVCAFGGVPRKLDTRPPVSLPEFPVYITVGGRAKQKRQFEHHLQFRTNKNGVSTQHD